MSDQPCYDADVMRRTLESDGYQPCDAPACNCGGWHPSPSGVGFYARFRELDDVLGPDNGETLKTCAERLVVEVEASRRLLSDKERERVACDRIAEERDALKAERERTEAGLRRLCGRMVGDLGLKIIALEEGLWREPAADGGEVG